MSGTNTNPANFSTNGVRSYFGTDKETGAFKPNSGWWTSFLTDESQLEPIKKVYEITTVPLTDEEIISSAHLYNYLKQHGYS
jgi:hypothetical protein